jgi:signal transduction histidine kinase
LINLISFVKSLVKVSYPTLLGLFAFVISLPISSEAFDLNRISEDQIQEIRTAILYPDTTISFPTIHNQKISNNCVLSAQKVCGGYRLNQDFIKFVNQPNHPSSIAVTLKDTRSFRGVGVYELSFQNLKSNTYSIAFPLKACWSACNVWGYREGEFFFLGGAGVVSSDLKFLESHFYHRLEIPLEFDKIYVEVASFEHADFSLNYLYLGQKRDIQALQLKWTFFPILIIGVFLYSFIYHLNLYFNHRNLKYSLWFSMFSLLIFFRVFTVNGYFELFFPSFPFVIRMKIEYICFIFPMFGFTFYLDFFLEKTLNFILLRIVQAYLLFWTIFVIFTPPYVFTNLLNLVQIGTVSSILLMAIETIRISFFSNHDQNIKWYGKLIGFNALLFLVLYLVDIFTGQYYLMNVALMIFTLIQALIINDKSGRMWKLAEHLSENLKIEVKERTREIEESRNELSRAERESSVNQLAAHLAHEVNNPLNYIATGQILIEDGLKDSKSVVLGAIPDSPETNDFRRKIEKAYELIEDGLKQSQKGKERIQDTISEIRAITRVDGLQIINFSPYEIIDKNIKITLEKNQINTNQFKIWWNGKLYPEIPFDSNKSLSNPHILGRVFRTLLSSQIYFSNKEMNPEILIKTSYEVSQNIKILTISISAKSKPIPNDKIREIFDLKKSKTHGVELIGLAMVKELVKTIQGNLILSDSGEKSGLVEFQIYLKDYE